MMLKKSMAVVAVFVLMLSAVALTAVQLTAREVPTDKTESAVMLYVSSPVAYVSNAENRIDPANAADNPSIKMAMEKIHPIAVCGTANRSSR